MDIERFIEACRNNNIDEVKKYIGKDDVDVFGDSYRESANDYPYPSLDICEEYKCYDLLEILLLDITGREEYKGFCPISYIVGSSLPDGIIIEIIEKLLEVGENINGRKNHSPFLTMIRYCSWDIYDFFINKGVDVNCIYRGKPPLILL